MSPQGRVELTITEIIATLQRSALPNVIVEGRDDIIVYRRMEDLFADLGLSVFAVGGRNAVIEIFDNRTAIAGGALAFVADRDSWVIDGVPPCYLDDSLVLTDGYSLENDAIRDGRLLDLLTASELADFRSDLSLFLRWYCRRLKRRLEGEDVPIKAHPIAVLSAPNDHAAVQELEEIDEAHTPLHDQLYSDWMKLVRGKSLLSLIAKQTNRPNRVAKHSLAAMMEMAGARGGPLISAIFENVRTRISNTLSTQSTA